MNRAHRPDGAGLDPLACQAQAFARVPVVAHLRDQTRLLRHARHHPRLLNRVGHRFFDINVLPRPQRGQRDGGMHVVGRGDHHGIDVLPLFEQDAIVLEPLGIRERPGRVRRLAPVHVAECDDILALEVVEHAAALPTHADPGDVELLARWRQALAKDVARDDLKTRGCRGCHFEEPSSWDHNWVRC